MGQEIKLKCPVCSVVFKTRHNIKVYCSSDCGKKHALINRQIRLNEEKREMINKEYTTYFIDEDKIKITSMMK